LGLCLCQGLCLGQGLGQGLNLDCGLIRGQGLIRGRGLGVSMFRKSYSQSRSCFRSLFGFWSRSLSGSRSGYE
jgi:hypothetical protein